MMLRLTQRIFLFAVCSFMLAFLRSEQMKINLLRLSLSNGALLSKTDQYKRLGNTATLLHDSETSSKVLLAKPV